MLNLKTFLKGFFMFIEIFEFTNSELYTEMVYSALKDKLTDKRFLDTCNHLLIETTKDDWNKAYGFKGRPAIKDWLDVFIPKKIEKRKYEICKITGARLVKCCFEYPDDYLQEIESEQKRLQLNSEKKQLEGQQSTQNQKNIQTYIKQINNNLKSS